MNGGEYQVSAPWIGGILAGICTVFGTLVGALYHRDQKKFGVLFKWKDEKVETFIESIPKEYVRLDRCDVRHMEVRDMFKEIRDEQKHQRRLLERHTGIYGEDGAQH